MVIENQQENRMVKQWVQPPKKKNATWRFFIRVPSDKFYFYFYLLRFSLEY